MTESESVWDYPRPPRVEATEKLIVIAFGGQTIVKTSSAHRVLETSHPPVYYIPREEIAAGALVPAGGRTSFCEWKGSASYFDVVGRDGRRADRAAWTYPNPSPGFEAIRESVAFYPAAMDECTVDGVRVTPQPGGFYGGWITPELVGPFKGEPGSAGW
jgi:uncharacterized protein (DUF427 family)